MAGLCKLKARTRSIAGGAGIATNDQQGRPSIENESLFQGEAEASVARFDAAYLDFGEARENRPGPRRKLPGEVWSKPVQHIFDQIGEHQVGATVAQPSMIEAACFDGVEQRPHRIYPRILCGGPDGDGIV